jgi:hypothetical protein
MAYTYRHGDRPIEGFTVQRAVGRGGFGEVYYALADSGKQVALKYLRDNPEVELRGVAHVMNLKSPHLITIYDVRRNSEGDPFVVMEYIGGPSLRDLMNADPRGMGAQKAAYFLVGIAKGLSYLHERGIVHRDLKPANIFYDDGYVKIGDYGLSKHIAVSRHSAQTVSVGTVHYMAPEIGSGNYSKAIDIYALGVILFEMLTGRLPFTGGSMGEILMRHLSERPDLAGVPEPFATVIARALVKDPAGRYQDVNEMVDAITSVVDISQSVSTFDPATLTRVPRQAPTQDERTLTRSPAPPPRRPVELDAHAPVAPDIPPLPGEVRAARRQQRAERNEPEMPGVRKRDRARLRRKMEHTDDLARRYGDQIVAEAAMAQGQREAPSPVSRGSRLAQFFTVALATVAAAALLALIAGERQFPQATIVFSMILAGAVLGPLAAHLLLLRHSPLRSAILDRVVYAGAALAAMAPGLSAATNLDRDVPRLAIPVLAMIVICDWNRRIEGGRKLRGGSNDAWVPGIIGLAGAAMIRATSLTWTGCVLNIAVALLTQAAAAMFPLGRRIPVAAPPAAPRAAGGWQQPDAPEPGGFPATPGRRPVTAAQMDERSLPPLDAQPSFAGRTANTGLAILAKLLIVGTIAMAMFFLFTMPMARPVHAGPEWPLPPGAPTPPVVDGHPSAPGTWQIVTVSAPRLRINLFSVLVPLALGTLLLVAARRNDGAMHVMRGVVGCLFGAAAVLLALGPGPGAFGAVMNRDPQNFFGGMVALVGLTWLAALSISLLLWPRRGAWRLRRVIHV